MAIFTQRVEGLLQLSVLEGGQQGLHVREARPGRACCHGLRDVSRQGGCRAATLHGKQRSYSLPCSHLL